MNIESIRDYCLSLPATSEYFPFDETTLAFRVANKIFAMIDLDNTEWFVLKCDPDYAVELRESHPEITGAWHMNKKHWNQLNLYGHLPDSLIQHLIRHSYELVVKKLPRKVKEAHRGGDTQGIEERGQVQGNEEPFLRFDVHGRQYRGENA